MASAPDGPVAGLCRCLAQGCWRRAQAAETVFTVGNYPVEARADNAVAAKNQALADGQQAAFRSLLKRLVPVTAYPRIKSARPIKAGDLIDGYKVRSERNSATHYIASLDFSFQSKAVRDLLRRKASPSRTSRRRPSPSFLFGATDRPARRATTRPGPISGRGSTSSTR